jgi:two-component system, NarL family, nitrate/nitrite response regulator NarL
MPETGANVRRRVVVVADDPLARGGLALLVAADPRLEVVGELAFRDDLGDQIAAVDADVAVCDLGPNVAVADHVATLGDALPLVCLIADEGQARELLALGVRGLLRREASAVRICAAVAAVADGLIALDDALADLFEERRAAPRSALETLTPRELEVLELVAEGLSNKLIAVRLEISEHTAKFHVNTILNKLGAQSRTEAVVRAARLGLLSL